MIKKGIQRQEIKKRERNSKWKRRQEKTKRLDGRRRAEIKWGENEWNRITRRRKKEKEKGRRAENRRRGHVHEVKQSKSA